MRSQAGIVFGVLVAFAHVGTVSADAFGELADKAEVLADASGLAGLFWSSTADCLKAGDELSRRQCEGIKAARAARIDATSYLVPGDAAALTVGEFESGKGGVSVTVTGCIACTAAADVDGEARFLTTRGDVKTEGGQARGPVVAKVMKKFRSADEARAWKDSVLPRLRTEFLVKVPGKAVEWQAGGGRGFSVELLGFRVYDPCEGQVVAASPAADHVKANKRACGKAALEPAEAPAAAALVPVVDERPASLSASHVKTAMRGAREGVDACFAQFGVPGKADLTIEVLGDGKVKKTELRGPFKDTPTGACIVESVKKTEFPPFKAGNMIINYPFILR